MYPRTPRISDASRQSFFLFGPRGTGKTTWLKQRFPNAIAAIAYRSLKLELFFWRTAAGAEVDFVAYGGDGLFAIEVKRSRTVRRADLRRLEQFKSDYPMARCLLLFGGDRREYRDGIELLPEADALGDPTSMLAAPHNSRRG